MFPATLQVAEQNRSIRQANELAYGSVFTIFRRFTTNFTLISLIFEFHDLSVLFCRYLFSLWLVIPVFSASLLEAADQTTDAYHKHVNLAYGYLFTDFQEHDQFYRDLFNLREFMNCRSCFCRFILLVICRPVFPGSLVQVADQTTDACNKHVNELMDLYLQFFRSTISLRQWFL